MIPRSLAVPTLLVASVAVPYVATNAPEWSRKFREGGAPAPAAPAAAAGIEAAPPAATAPNPALTATPQGPGSNLFPTQTPLEGAPSYSLAEVFRFDVTKEWVYQRWARKSTALSQLDLFGVRVPLVTGAKLHDLAGSLTYYFTPDGRLQRISFRGRTGDTSQLFGLLARQHGFMAYPSTVAGEQLLQVRRGDDVISEVRTRPSPVLWASSPHDSFTVELEMQNPATAKPLAPPLAALPQPTPAPQVAAAPPAAEQAAAATAEEAAKKKEPAWKAFFPRSRIPKKQVDQLDAVRLYQ
jgi:hypothetical protein